jgi:hypothetical protein
VAAPGYRPQFVTQVDPATGPLTVQLERLALDKFTTRQKLRGRLIDPAGQPIFGAKVDFEGIHNEDGGGSYGAVAGVDPLAVTDRNGDFLLTSAKPFASMSVTVEARGFARSKYQQLASGSVHELRQTKGATVIGRLVLNHKAVPNAAIGMVGCNRSIDESIGNYQAITDDQGQFLFPNVPAGKACFMYSLMSEAGANGGVRPITRFVTANDNATNDLGEMAVLPAYRLRGRIRLSDDKPLPAGTRAMLGREDAWDTLPNVEVATDGSFTFNGVPAESVGLSVRVPGYRFSLANPSLDRLNGFSLVGRVTGNIDSLLILLEPGEFSYDSGRSHSPDDQPRDKPLRGLPPDKLPPR